MEDRFDLNCSRSWHNLPCSQDIPTSFTKQDDDENEVVERTEDDGNQSNKPIELFESEEAFKQK